MTTAADRRRAWRALRPWVTPETMGLRPDEARVVIGAVFDTIEASVEHLPTGAEAHASIQVDYLLAIASDAPSLAGIADRLASCLRADRARVEAEKKGAP